MNSYLLSPLPAHLCSEVGLCNYSMENDGFEERQEAVASGGIGEGWEWDRQALTPGLLSTECCSALGVFSLALEFKSLLGQPHRKGAGKSLGATVFQGVRS